MKDVVAAAMVAVAVMACIPSALAARAEQGRIDALLAAVESSGCKFERNGTQYSAAEGSSHLRMKLDSAGDRVQTAAQFIKYIGSGSSLSGKPYRVLCPGQPAQTSQQWLERRLQDLSAAAK
jgi:hypothetical protein